ncbi:tRNA (adenosine(37)-N6)-threonylcarbamoyltransferase complex ATPase subunit type 1 TsaE [Candidatus Desantisbacteria bacterium CG2_30_40_21]|uniref:tRNA threonylcarbamoyladenosine biosynthesis protein TsaE n=5 Tax=unclassified Candidatus Desantisiibacteriota TaxID=3106372 RepID=A0A2M7JE95_9BACT|nr:MAG: tRNA (adenosine(37)-N6)-threonylcarbamoyltransferase complex ATPase subunit type 1 TsaE [Candidatus Desantisbacteria bacterium CG2_30_40_21]PIP40517.1 MAG: tRNA (adenosine(37)-N6)-threonylcarbamoyltransferase complex ATPase subunit type 1 TsaE [Candidatus Desantisbacteria bacterium CG23_combo_of_CG06-09_8_20_14_all_40_23]PIX17739.1 MAG: tRNA (adenosine(37)-N6)-threonylcarbamoyltransferase complex ATPase subunit type 1 TsaE [Candidatus Desantisbacteria bacterium CG_4_8_14_3_um_filter_40_12
MLTLTTHNPEQTMSIGERLGRVLHEGCIIALIGGLGAGKTVLTKGIARGLEIKEDITSPTFLIVKEYIYGRLPLYHFDLYRLDNISQSGLFDIDEYLFGNGICIIEWAERMEEILPPMHLRIEIQWNKGNQRQINLIPKGDRTNYQGIIEKFLHKA